MTLTVDGEELLVHDIGILVTAPAEVTVGENRIDLNVTVRRFTGRIHEIRKVVTSG